MKICVISQCFIQSPLLSPSLSAGQHKHAQHRILNSCASHLFCTFFQCDDRHIPSGEVYAHQLDALMVDHDHCCDGPFDDVFSIGDSLTPFLVQQNFNPVFVLVFSCSHASDASPNFLPLLVSKSRSAKLHPICTLQDHVSFLRFAHLSSLISYFGSTIEVMSFSSVFALYLFSFIVFAAAQIFATAHRFASAVSFADAAVLKFFIKASHTQWNVTVNISEFVSASSSSFRIFVFSHFCFIVSAFSSGACWKVTVNFFRAFVCRHLHVFRCRAFVFLFLCAFDYS